MARKKAKSHDGLKFLATAAAVAAGGYFLYGKNAAKNRKKVKGWMLKVKGEVLEEIEKLEEIDKDHYHKIIDSVIKRYKGAKNADEKEIDALVKELKGHWASISRSFKKGSKTGAKKLTKKQVKKPVSKKAKK